MDAEVSVGSVRKRLRLYGKTNCVEIAGKDDEFWTFFATKLSGAALPSVRMRSTGNVGQLVTSFAHAAQIRGVLESDAIAGDFNLDGVVNGEDLTMLLSKWGPCEGCIEDINEDGMVGGADLTVVLTNWSS